MTGDTVLALPSKVAIVLSKLRSWFAPKAIALPVDCGHVRCPVHARDLDIERCVGCNFLREVLPDAQHHAKEIICQPPLTSMLRADL